MKNIYLILILLVFVWAEEPLIKFNISDSHEAVVSLDQKTIKVMDRASKKVLIAQKISFDDESKNVITQKSDIFMVDNVPLLHFSDFNFDGNRDILIYADGYTAHNTLYLYKNNTFVKDETLPHFNLNGWGIYKVDKKNKKITISNTCESYRDLGCYRVFEYRDGKFEEEESLQAYDDMYEPYYTEIKHIIENSKKSITKSKYIVNKEQKDFAAEFEFVLSNKEKVYLLLDEVRHDMTLMFFHTGIDNVAFDAYPTRSLGVFVLDMSNPKQTTLKFKTKTASYTIYQKNRGTKIKELGIIIEKRNKSKKLIGVPSSRVGDLRKLNRDIVNITRVVR